MGTPASTAEAKQALLAFKGDVSSGVELTAGARRISPSPKNTSASSAVSTACSACYLIEPYRLEMGTRLKTKRGADLYQFWDAAITGALRTRWRRPTTRCADQPRLDRILLRRADRPAPGARRSSRLQGRKERRV
ncbi:MAG: peroxide stress protein YaaA [Verrucomicrobiales bacterium]